MNVDSAQLVQSPAMHTTKHLDTNTALTLTTLPRHHTVQLSSKNLWHPPPVRALEDVGRSVPIHAEPDSVYDVVTCCPDLNGLCCVRPVRLDVLDTHSLRARADRVADHHACSLAYCGQLRARGALDLRHDHLYWSLDGVALLRPCWNNLLLCQRDPSFGVLVEAAAVA